jgi:predicted esterase
MMTRRVSSAIFTAAGFVALAAATVFAQCTPFGNPPQQLLSSPKPSCAGGGHLMGPSPDSDGTPRYACLYAPASASKSNPLPLLIYLHPSTVTADSLPEGTNLLSFLKTGNLSGNSAKLGFIALAPEGRNITHLFGPPGSFDSSGPGWDNWYRQVAPTGDVTIAGTTYPENVDAATIDLFTAQVIATGKVDPNRIFLTGWSNGASMAVLYGLSRPNIAAIAPYSGPNPMGYLLDPCYQTPVTGTPASVAQLQLYNPGAPIDHVHNNCDIAGSCPNAENLAMQLGAIGVFVQDSIITGPQAPANECDFTCGDDLDGSADETSLSSTGVKNHTRWPTQWTLGMLDFFRRHPLNQRGQ